MKINGEKSKLMLFNMTQKYRFPPELSFSDGNYLEVLDSMKVLGVIISNSLKWKENTDFITSKARAEIWTIRRLDNLGFDDQFILDVYKKEIRSILEYNVPVWNGSITRKESNKIEDVQKSVLRVLLKNKYSPYTEACKTFKLEKLYKRRIQLCIKFSRKEYNKQNNGIFTKAQSKSKRIKNNMLVTEPKARTSRYYKSAIPYLSRLLNSEKLIS